MLRYKRNKRRDHMADYRIVGNMKRGLPSIKGVVLAAAAKRNSRRRRRPWWLYTGCAHNAAMARADGQLWPQLISGKFRRSPLASLARRYDMRGPRVMAAG